MNRMNYREASLFAACCREFISLRARRLGAPLVLWTISVFGVLIALENIAAPGCL